MGKNANSLTEDTVIEVGGSISLGQYRDFFRKALGVKFNPKDDLYFWLNFQTGKTLKEALEVYGKPIELKSMAEILSEKRFDMLSKPDKDFIIAFDKEISKLGYDFGGGIGKGNLGSKYMIFYSKAGVKSKKAVARIFLWDNEIILKLIFDNVQKHSAYIEASPEHIKEVFVSERDDCRKCNPNGEVCRMTKNYTLDGRQIQKCSECVFQFLEPNLDKLPDYINLLAEFYPARKK